MLAQQITSIYFDSDGAPSHFKLKGTLHYVSTLRSEPSRPVDKWMFGAPGHGKGPHNGLGGIMKNKLRRHFLAHDLHISNSKQVYEVAIQQFDSPEARERYDQSPHVAIKHWVILWLDSSDITRPLWPKEKKKRKSTGDVALDEGD